MQDAIIIGGGITGLATGYLLQQKGYDVSVIEKSLRPGGPVQSVAHNGYLVEKGPNSLLLPDQWVEDLIHELGLRPDVVETDPAARKRYIVRRGRPVAVPSSVFQAATTPLFSLKAKLGMLGEPFRKRRPDIDEDTETVAAFVTRRLGQEFLDYAVDPLVSGIYAGDTHELVLKHAFPFLLELEREEGSLIRGALARKKQASTASSYKKRSINFKSGLATLPKTIARKLGNRLWLGSTVAAVNPNDEGWQVTWKRDGENFEGFTKNILVCLPARAVKSLAWPQTIADAVAIAPDLPCPAVHCLGLGYDRSKVAHPLDGFGMLVPGKENFNILGALFNSSLYPHRAPQGECLLTVMIGGQKRPDLAKIPEEELVKLATRDLATLLGVQGTPNFKYLTTWPHAIPQYTEAFGPWKKSLQSIETSFPTLHFGGHAIDGISLAASLLSAKRLSEKLTSPS